MTAVNGLTAVRRIGAPAAADATQAQRGTPLTRAGDTFDVNHAATTGPAHFDQSVTSTGSHILRADTNTTAAHHDATTGTAHALTQVRESAAKALERANSTVQPGDVMSHNDAVAKIVEIYSAAFPGIGFTEGELAGPIKMLQSGQVTAEELASRVQEGAKLINDPNAMADQAAQQVEAGRPNRRSVVAQQLRMDRLATLMEMGYVPEGKFNLVGGFSYNGGGQAAQGQFLGGVNGGGQDPSKGLTAAQLRSASVGLSRDMAKSFERYRANTKDAGTDLENKHQAAGPLTPNGLKKVGGKALIQGTETNETGPVNTTTAFGQGSTNQVSVSGASLSSLKQASSELSQASQQTHSPVMLDLNHDGRMGVTGNSSAKNRADGVMNAKVDFDIDGNGKKEHIEWMKGDGDGMLVDDRDGGATAAMHGNGEISGARLFGDEGGKYANGYDKLKGLDANHDGKLTGHELDGLKTWVDDGDAKLEEGELKTMAELGVTSIDVKMQLTANDRGENLMRSTFTQNGQEHVSEDVWFAEQHEQHMPNLAAAADTVTERASGPTLAALIARIDSTLAQLDNVSRQVEQAHSINALANHAHQAILAHGFRA